MRLRSGCRTGFPTGRIIWSSPHAMPRPSTTAPSPISASTVRAGRLRCCRPAISRTICSAPPPAVWGPRPTGGSAFFRTGSCRAASGRKRWASSGSSSSNAFSANSPAGSSSCGRWKTSVTPRRCGSCASIPASWKNAFSWTAAATDWTACCGRMRC